MPWDASAVLLVSLDRVACTVHADEHATLQASGPVQRVAGGVAESVGQPAWARDGSLRFVSDRSGWWQPYRHSGHVGTDESPTRSTATEAEFHGPDWVLSQQTMAETAAGALVVRMTTAGRDALVRLDPERQPHALAQPCVSVTALCAHGSGHHAHREHARRAVHRLVLATPRTRPTPCVPRPRSALRRRTSRWGSPSP